jgi:hypothetical protein
MQSPLLDHLFTPKPDFPSENRDHLKKQISKFAKVGCQLAVAAGMPSKLKIYIDALLAIANGRDEFTASNDELVLYIRNNRNITQISAERTVTRYATALYEWQDEAKIGFVYRLRGGKDMATGESFRSEYKLPILGVIADILENGGWNHYPESDQMEVLDSLRIDPDKLSGSTGDISEDMEAAVHDLNRAFFLAGTKSTQQFRNRPSKVKKRKPEWDLKAALTLLTKAVSNCTFSNQEEHLLRDIKAAVESGLASFPELVVDDEDVSQSTAKDNSVRQRNNTGETEKGARGGAREDSPFSDPSESEPPFVQVETPTAVAPMASETAPDKSTPPRAPKKEFLEVPLLALEAFKSVGAESFFSMYKCEVTGKPISEFTRSAERFENELHTYFIRSECEKVSFCVRPEVDHMIQLDDLTEADVNLFKPFSFLSVETSPGNFQSWIALDVASAARRYEIRQQLLRKLAGLGGVDKSASGSLRFPGFRNFKNKHKDAGFPRVKVTAVALGNRVSESTLAAADLLLPPPVLHPPVYEASSKFNHSSKSPTVFPSWERECISLTPEGAVDRSKADFRWCMIAFDWGWSEQAIMAELRRVSPLAAKAPQRYIERTVRNAIEKVNRA